MKRGLWLLAALVAGGVRTRGADMTGLSIPEMVKEAVTAYRDGRMTDALRGSARVLEADPANAAAKNLIWTVAKEAQKRHGRAVLARGEKERAAALARKYLEVQRARTERALTELKKVDERSEDLRSPTGLLAALGGLDQSLGGAEPVRYGDRAQVHFSNILRNLRTALDKQVFASRKDHMRAQGYLAYYGKDWDKAAALWEKALQEDPEDAQVRNDLDSLKTLLQRRKERDELKDLVAQAETYFETGLYAQAAESWREVLKRDRRYPGAAESLAASRVAADKAEQQKRLKAMMEEASAEHKAGRPLKAAEICLEALQIDPAYHQARMLLRLVGKKLDTPEPPRPQAASAAAAPAPQAAPGQGPGQTEKAEPLYKRGLLLYAEGEVAGAVKLWREALTLDPGLKKAREALRQGESELAILQK